MTANQDLSFYIQIMPWAQSPQLMLTFEGCQGRIHIIFPTKPFRDSIFKTQMHIQ